MVQTVNAAFTAEERDTVRSIAQSLLVSWHKQSLLGNRTFTIAVSLIGGNDIIGVNPGTVGSPGNYKYFDESAYVMHLGWERGFSIPTGGLTIAMAEAILDNTSRRFTPRYMGGNSELNTAILPQRPVMISAGFNLGADLTVPQFAGVISEQPDVDMRDRTLSLKMMDYMAYFKDRYMDQAVMFTAQRTDQVLTTLFSQIGMNTAQYDLDTGINIIPFGMFPAGTRFSEAIGQLVEAENGHIYQREDGVFVFENRQHWSAAPYTQVQRVIATAQVINAQAPNQDHLINTVEINSKIIAKQAKQPVFSLSQPLAIAANGDATLFVNFDDPILLLDNPTFWTANTLTDGTGTDISTLITLKSISVFAQAAKIVFSSRSSSDGFITDLTLYGRPARSIADLHYRTKDDSSVTAFQEKSLTINNPFIQNISWAQSYAQMILNDFSVPENLQRITMKAMPELQLGDLVSWQGRWWRIFDIKTTLNPMDGFIQELLLLQRTITTYFRIGFSTIGGSDRIAP